MSTTRVLHLDAYRGRRQQRVERTLALLRPDSVRHPLAELLASVLAEIGGDRAAVVWIDEFGPLIPRPHVLLDLQGDPPRRQFDGRVLQAAWDEGVPGTADFPDLQRGRGVPEGPRSAACVCLGSDGLRTWFLVVDSVAPRGPLDEDVRERLLELAGRSTAFLLHRDIVPGEKGPGTAEAFTGWSVLSDVDTEGALEDRVTERFLIMRLVRACLDDDLVPEAEHMARRAADLRAELQHGEERPYWDAVLDAVVAGDAAALGRAVLEVGLRAENLGELEGALEAFRTGYWIAALSGHGQGALDGARYLARTLRRAGRWDDSERWYSQAVVLGRCLGDAAGEALALDGQAATLRARGNTPGAALALEEALEAAERSGDPHALGSVNMHLMTLHHLAGRGGEAIHHGWAGVRAYQARRDQLRALVALAGILLDLGAVALAEEAYAVALERVEEGYFRAFALEGHAHAAALRGDRKEYERRYLRVVDEAWAAGGVDFQAQALLYRGRAYQALGDVDQARTFYEQALEFAEETGLNSYVFQVEDALRALDGSRDAGAEPAPPTLPAHTLEEVRGGLGRLRRELATAGA